MAEWNLWLLFFALLHIGSWKGVSPKATGNLFVAHLNLQAGTFHVVYDFANKAERFEPSGHRWVVIFGKTKVEVRIWSVGGPWIWKIPTSISHVKYQSVCSHLSRSTLPYLPPIHSSDRSPSIFMDAWYRFLRSRLEESSCRPKSSHRRLNSRSSLAEAGHFFVCIERKDAGIRVIIITDNYIILHATSSPNLHDIPRKIAF